jgi:hypothetical protein
MAEKVLYFNAKKEKGLKVEPIDTVLFGTVHRAKKINSKVKGNRNELVVSKLLSEWTGHEFTRVPRSGGLRWSIRADICGDTINVDRDFNFPFSVETKFVKSLGLPTEDHHELRKNSVIYTFFEQCRIDAIAAKKHPFLIVRQNGMPTGNYYVFLDLTFCQLMKIINYIKPKYSGELCGFRSEDFFQCVNLETLKWIYNSNSKE